MSLSKPSNVMTIQTDANATKSHGKALVAQSLSRGSRAARGASSKRMSSARLEIGILKKLFDLEFEDGQSRRDNRSFTSRVGASPR